MISLSSTGDSIIGSGIALAIIASIAVLLRLATKKVAKAGLAADDCWITFALVTFWVYVGVELWGNMSRLAQALGFESNFQPTGIYAGAGGAHMDNFRSSNPSGILLFFKVRTVLRLRLSWTNTCKIVDSCRHLAFCCDNYWSQVLNPKPLLSNFPLVLVSARYCGAGRYLCLLATRSDPLLGICLLRTVVVPLHRFQ